MVFRELKLIAAGFVALAALGPTSLLAQGDMGASGTVVLENMVREQNPLSYGDETYRSRSISKNRTCKTAKKRSCRRSYRQI